MENFLCPPGKQLDELVYLTAGIQRHGMLALTQVLRDLLPASVHLPDPSQSGRGRIWGWACLSHCDSAASAATRGPGLHSLGYDFVFSLTTTCSSQVPGTTSTKDHRQISILQSRWPILLRYGNGSITIHAYCSLHVVPASRLDHLRPRPCPRCLIASRKSATS